MLLLPRGKKKCFVRIFRGKFLFLKILSVSCVRDRTHTHTETHANAHTHKHSACLSLANNPRRRPSFQSTLPSFASCIRIKYMCDLRRLQIALLHMPAKSREGTLRKDSCVTVYGCFVLVRGLVLTGFFFIYKRKSVQLFLSSPCPPDQCGYRSHWPLRW